jgi:hypothetical protein
MAQGETAQAVAPPWLPTVMRELEEAYSHICERTGWGRISVEIEVKGSDVKFCEVAPKVSVKLG